MSPEKSVSRIIAYVDPTAIRDNLARVHAYAPRSRIMAVVKANAYGHGIIPVAKTLEECGVDALAVACLDEGLVLREAGIRSPLVILEGVLSAEEAMAAVAEHMVIVVHGAWQIELLKELPTSMPPQFWIKLDSGMNRLGFSCEGAAPLWAIVEQHPEWKFHGWMTHLACADQRESSMTPQQIARFNSALEGLPGERSIGNSAGLIAWTGARSDWIRPGLMLYGASPFPDQSAVDLGLRPAMEVKSRIIAVRDLAAGEPVGYGAAWTSTRPTRIGVVAAGYADGIRRTLSSGTPLLIGERRTSIIGRISMDMIVIDLHDTPEAQVGDEVVLWGRGLPAEEIASRAGTLAYELFCGLSNRIKYHYGEP